MGLFYRASSETTLASKDDSERSSMETLGDKLAIEPLTTQRLFGKFEPRSITHLNLSIVDSCKRDIFYSGCLPEWIQNFQNLEVLSAAKMGIVTLEPWLLNLPKLEALNLEQNQIGTWPAFLSESSTIKSVILDGNPCLEKAFHKSPTLRSLYFSWNATTAAYKNIPYFIRGPEWHIASTTRSSSSINIDNLGFFCGGIYTMATRPDLSDDGYLTPIEPCVLMARQNVEFVDKSTCKSSNEHILESLQCRAPLYKGEGKRQANIILEIFDDIVCLKNRYSIKQIEGKQQFVLLVGSMKDSFNLISKGALDRLNLNEMQRLAGELLSEEERHITKMKIVEQEFYYNRKIKSTTIACCLRNVFSGFPAMHIIHSKAVLPALQRFVKAIGFSQERRKNPDFIPEFSVNSTIVELCTAFRKLQLALQNYSENLWATEHHLDLRDSPTKMYEDSEFRNYVEKQIMRLGGLGGHTSLSSISPVIDLRSSGNVSDEDKNGLDTSKHILADWLYENTHKLNKIFKHNCVDFIYLPLMRLVRYERFFTSFAGTDVAYQPLLKVLRRLRKTCASKIELSRKYVRMRVLSSKFRTSIPYFQHYKWDAVFTVKSRGYLEPGLLNLNNNDVIDYDGTPASFVKESFSDARLRILRMIKCGNEVQIWDEVFEHLVGETHKSNILAVPVRGGSSKYVRLVFLDVRETCIIQVRDFNARYITRHHPNQEILEAFSSKSEKKVL